MVSPKWAILLKRTELEWSMNRKVVRHRTVPRFLRDWETALRWAFRSVDIGVRNDETVEYYGELAGIYSRFAQSAYREGSITVYRKIRVPVQNDKAAVSWNCLGKAWSSRRAGAGVYGIVPHQGGHLVEVTITAKVRPSDVDWAFGFTSFLYYGEDQWEVSMLPDSPVLVTAIDDSQVEPFQGNTGPAGEVWSHGCKELGRCG